MQQENHAAMPNGQSESKRLYLQIAEKLAQTISAGDTVPGNRLPAERDLAAQYDVSRQTIREALIALEVSGLVVIRPGSGVYVLKQEGLKTSLVSEDAPGPLEIMEARVLLEGEAAVLAAQKISNEELLKLKVYLTQMAKMVEEGKVAEAESFDGRFHQLIAKATRNGAISTMVEWLWQQRESSEISRVFQEKVRRLGANPNVAAHEKIYMNLCQRNATGAREAMQQHLSDVADTFVLAISDSN